MASVTGLGLSITAKNGLGTVVAALSGTLTLIKSLLVQNVKRLQLVYYYALYNFSVVRFS